MRIVLISIALVATAGVAYWLISPLFIDKTVIEELPPASSPLTVPTLSSTPSSTDASEVMPTPGAGEDVRMNEEMPQGVTEPRVVFEGRFVSVAHEGSGRAQIVDLGNDHLILRLVDLDVLNGPDLHVVLSSEADVAGTKKIGYTLEVAPLKGNKGTQNYELPEEFEASDYLSVMIYCQAFHVIFNSAFLEEAFEVTR